MPTPDSASIAAGHPTMGATLVAAFEPFEGRRRNRAWEAVRRLPPAPGLIVAQLPVVFSRLPAAIDELLARRPRALLLVGEARRPEVSVEQVALNLADGPDRPDNEGVKVTARPLVTEASAPLARKASWDAHAVAQALRQEAIAAQASFHAGTFACNASLYLALHRSTAEPSKGSAPPAMGSDGQSPPAPDAATPAPAPAIGFLHLPQAPWPRGPRLRTLIRAVQIAAHQLAQ
jgi:pyroglutamyl-peptidase